VIFELFWERYWYSGSDGNWEIDITVPHGE